MEKMREGLQRRARRMQENLQQSVGLSEKKDELQSVSHVEQRNQKIILAVKNTRQNLQNCIRSVNREEAIDKRKRRLDEFGLWQQLLTDAKELENVYPRSQPSVLADTLKLYGDAMGVILEERVLTDQLIEKSVLDAFGKYMDDDKILSKAKEKLARTVVDVEVSRKRKQGNHDESKAQEIQDEYDGLQLKLESYKDNIFTDIFILLSREAEIAGIYKELITAQMEYHRTALQKLENILPEIDRKIASYPNRPVFGCHLEDHLRCSNRSVALVLEVCCSILNYQGFQEKGLFRVSGNNNRIRRLKAAFDAHQINSSSLEIAEYINDPHSVCSVLKCYLRELPEPLMTHALHSEWVFIAKRDPDYRKEAIYRLLPSMPEANRYNLAYLIKFLNLILDYEEYTKMSVGNLSIVFGPNLIDAGNGTESENILGSKLVETLIVNANFFFPNYNFDYTSPLLDSFLQRKSDIINSFGSGDRMAARGTQGQQYIGFRHAQSNNSSCKNSVQLRNTTSVLQQTSQPLSASSTLRSRPKWPAPPPPVVGYSNCNSNSNNCTTNHSNLCNDSIEEMSSSLENLNNFISKSPSVASSDSMAEYGCTTNVEICDNFASQQMTRSYHETTRPLRPPPPRNVGRSSTPDGGFQTFTIDPVEHDNSQEVAKMLQPDLLRSRNSVEICRNAPVPVACTKDNRTVVHLDTDACHQHAGTLSGAESYNTLPKPPLPYKPKSIIDLNRPNEITKL
ncbi:RhoGAP domain-containing protein [Loa loa]|uniref:RhoGAP domain-containing protein n=1 Tax=Loa loa TaxID=7209 RepID=A0A1S0UFV5_LOALO|nr:RhoGAP domain-containing protein [Loa loa]EJD74469.1 RhoGAP domain-containing protein [Loa loa]